MVERILIILLPFIFLASFIIRNRIVKAKIKQQIRSSDPLLTTAVIFTNLCILTTIISTYSKWFYKLLGAISFLKHPIISYAGFFLFGVSIVMGWIFSGQLKESWRVGVLKDQKTELIQNGIYSYIRNPYFLTYFIIFVGLFLVRPSIVMAVLILATINIFHRLVIKEETHLLDIHGNKYEKYKNKTGRYIPHIFRR